MIFKIVIIFLFILISTTLKACWIGRTQTLKSRGQVFCDGVPIFKALVQLLDFDYFSKDDLLDSTVTDENGYFKVNGTCKEFFKMEGRIDIFHTCGVYKHRCFKKISFNVPKKFITYGPKPHKWYEVGSVQLTSDKHNKNFYKEKIICLHK